MITKYFAQFNQWIVVSVNLLVIRECYQLESSTKAGFVWSLKFGNTLLENYVKT